MPKKARNSNVLMPDWDEWVDHDLPFPLSNRSLHVDGMPKLGVPPYDENPWRGGHVQLYTEHDGPWLLSYGLAYGNGHQTLDLNRDGVQTNTWDLDEAKEFAEARVSIEMSKFCYEISQEFCEVCGHRLETDLDAERPGQYKPCRICELNAKIASTTP